MDEAIRAQTPAAAPAVPAPRLRIGWTTVALALLTAGAAAYYSACSLLIHFSFHSFGWDMGIFDQVLWSFAHGHGFYYSFRSMSYMGDHFQPVLMLLAPLVLLRLGPAPVLVAQGIAFAVAVVPLHAAVRNIVVRAGTPTPGRPEGRPYADNDGARFAGVAAWAVSLAYVVSLGVVQAANYDFHPECFVPLCAFTALWALTTGRTGVFAAATLALMPLKEDMFVLVLGMCWVAWLGFGVRGPAVRVGATAVAYSAVISLVVMPLIAHGHSNPLLERYSYLGDNSREIAINAVVRPDLLARHLAHLSELRTLVYLLVGVGFLPLLRPRLLPPLAALVVLPMLSTSDVQQALELHYGVVPYTFALVLAAMAMALREPQDERVVGGRLPRLPSLFHLRRTSGRSVLAAAGVLALLAVGLFVAKSPLPPSFAADAGRFEVDHHADVAQSFVDSVPGSVVVSAQANFVPHLSERRHIYEYPRIEDATVLLIDDKRAIPGYDLTGLEECKATIEEIGFRLVREEDGIRMYERSADDAARTNGGPVCW